MITKHLIGRTWNAVTCALSALFITISGSALAGDGPALPVLAATASANDGNVPANAVDGSLVTRWSAKGDGQWLRLDLGLSSTVGSVKIAWHKGNLRAALFEVQTSATGSSWTTVWSGLSSGATTALESYDVTDATARYVRILGHGNSQDLWNSVAEVEVYAPGSTTPTPPPTTNTNNAPLAVQSVNASGNDGNVPANTLDGSLDTRWSANGDGQWIAYNFGVSSQIGAANIAWHKGDSRISLFDIQTSANGTSWQTVYSGASSGATAGLETYNVTDSTGQYVRIVGHGNSQNLWNSISEVQFLGTNSGGGIIITNPPTNPPVTNTPLPTIKKTLAGLQMGNKKVVHYRNRPLDVYDPRVTRAIIMVHGSGANASGYFDRINNVIPAGFKDKVLVIAPHFQEEAEAASDEYWWDGDWREGGASGGVSSYAVADKFVELLRNGNFPNLKWIVIGGHSAGGQFSQRYAAFTDIDMKTTPNSQYVKFVPANPSSYVYLNEYRPDGNGNWIIPSECSSGEDGYNEWKYGLNGLYGYTAARGAQFARTNLPKRWVELLAGTFDNVVDDGLDLDCGAMRQGERRFDRAQNFNAFMDRYYPGNNFSMTLVPEVGHDSELIFASPEGRAAYFFAD